MEKKIQAKDISKEVILEAISKVYKHGNCGAILWDIQEELKHFPPKVVLAKLASLKHSKIIEGCICGCRGDFKIIEESLN